MLSPHHVDLTEADSNKWVKPSDQVSNCNTNAEPIVAPKVIRDNCDLWRPIKQRQRRFSANQELAVVADYANGGTVYSLATKYGCHRTTISRILKSRDVELANSLTDSATVDQIVRLYESGLSMTDTAERTGVSAKSVFNYVHRSHEDRSNMSAPT